MGSNKPTDLSVCVGEEREYEGCVVVKLNSEKRVSTGDVRDSELCMWDVVCVTEVDRHP